MTTCFNTLSRCPVLSVPTGRSKKAGVPAGIQIVGPPFEDAAVLRMGLAFEKAAGGWFRKAGAWPEI